MKWKINNEIFWNALDSAETLYFKILNRENDMAAAKNYTEEMVSTMTEQYTANPTRETVDVLATQFGKTTRSIIAKLSREGIYKAQPRTTKTGEPVISKAQYVSAVNAHFGVELPTLVKAGKQDLAKLAEVLGLEVVAN
jgi:hypothetical protein